MLKIQYWQKKCLSSTVTLVESSQYFVASSWERLALCRKASVLSLHLPWQKLPIWAFQQNVPKSRAQLGSSALAGKKKWHWMFMPICASSSHGSRWPRSTKWQQMAHMSESSHWWMWNRSSWGATAKHALWNESGFAVKTVPVVQWSRTPSFLLQWEAVFTALKLLTSETSVPN